MEAGAQNRTMALPDCSLWASGPFPPEADLMRRVFHV
jgi:hypothetical protein